MQTSNLRPIEHAFDAYCLFERTYELLAGDRAGRVDWDALLRLAIARWDGALSSVPGIAQWDELVRGRWIEEVSGRHVPLEVPFKTAVAGRIGQALTMWMGYDLEQASPETLDVGLSDLLMRRFRQPGVLMLSQRATDLIMHALSPGKDQDLLCIGGGTGEIVSEYLRWAWELHGQSLGKVRVVENRTSLHPLIQLRAVVGCGGPSAINAIEILGAFPQGSELPTLIFASLIDDQEDLDQYHKVERLQQQIRFLVESAPEGARIALLVPEVLLNGSTWSQTREFLVSTGYLRLVAQFPEEALKLGAARFALVTLEKEDSWPSRTGVIMADLPLEGNDLPLDIITAVANALASKDPGTTSVWYQDRPTVRRLDPRFYRHRESVGMTLKQLQEPQHSLGDLLTGLLRSQTSPPYYGQDAELLVPPAAVGKLQIITSECSRQAAHWGIELNEGSVVLVISGSVGRAAAVPPGLGPARAGTGLAVLYPKPAILDPEYLAVLLESDLGQRMLSLITKGTQRLYLPLHELRTLKVPVPSLARQREIAQEVLGSFGKAQNLRMQADACEAEARGIFERLQPKRTVAPTYPRKQR